MVENLNTITDYTDLVCRIVQLKYCGIFFLYCIVIFVIVEIWFVHMSKMVKIYLQTFVYLTLFVYKCAFKYKETLKKINVKNVMFYWI